MTPYFLVYAIISMFAIFDFSIEQRKVKTLLMFLLGIFFICFAGFRWDVGTDWEQYLYFFDVVDLSSIGQAGHEFFYEILLRISKNIFDNYTAMLFLTACIIVYFTYSGIKKYSVYPILSILILYSYSINSSGFGYRQDIAIAIVFFAFRYIQERKLIKFLVWIFIATLFHQTAIIFTCAYWVYNFKWNIKYFMILVVSTVLVYILMSKLDFIAGLYTQSAQGKLDYYMDNKDETFGAGDANTVLIRGIFNRIFLLVIPLIVIFTRKDEKVEELKKLYNIFLFGFIFFIVFGSVAVVFLRFTRYFDIFQILVIPLALRLSAPKHRFPLLILLIIYLFIKFLLVIINDNDIYVPYKTIFDI